MLETPRKFWNSVMTSVKIVGVLWVIQLLQYVLGLDLGYYGIYPRETFGLKGILFAPLLHGSWEHLISNSVPLLVLLTLIFFFYRRIATKSIVLIYILTGLAVWTFARPVFHIGASGVVYGLVSFIFWNGIFRRNIRSIALALIVFFLYSGMVFGILPNQPGISWESHLLGAIAGIFVSYLFRNQLETQEEEMARRKRTLSKPQEHFYDRNVFEKTIEERQREERQRLELEEELRRRSLSGNADNNWFSDRTF